MSFTRKLVPLACLAAIGAASPASAAFVIYTDQAAFLAAISAPGTDTYDDLATASLPGPISRTAGAYAYTAAVGPNSPNLFPGRDGATDVFLSSNNRLDTITLSGFASGVVGAGGLFFGSDIGGSPTSAASITVNFTDADGTVSRVVLNPTTASFLGAVSDSGLTGVSFLIGDQVGVWPSLDDLTLGAASGVVPEPATWAMMILGVGMVGGSLRASRRRGVASHAAV